MKIIKTTLGWEVQPQTGDEEAHLKWLLHYLAIVPAKQNAKDLDEDWRKWPTRAKQRLVERLREQEALR